MRCHGGIRHGRKASTVSGIHVSERNRVRIRFIENQLTRLLLHLSKLVRTDTTSILTEQWTAINEKATPTYIVPAWSIHVEVIAPDDERKRSKIEPVVWTPQT